MERVDLNALDRAGVHRRASPKTIRHLRAAARKQGKTISDIAEERLVFT